MENFISSERFKELTDKFNSLDPLMIVGDLCIDKYTHGNVKRISPEAPVPILEVTKEWHTLGMAANISHNLQALGVNSTLCGVVGEDIRASIAENLLEESKLKTWGIVRSNDRPTTFKERITTGTQQICRVDYEKKLPLSSSTEEKLIARIKDLSENHSAFILEDYAKGTLTERVIKEVMGMAKDQEKILAVDPGRNVNPLLYKGADLFKPNHSEAKLITTQLGYETEDISEMARVLIDKLDLKKVVITLGGEGMALVDTEVSDKMTVIPTAAFEVFDVSGAGDTAISLLTSSLVAGANLTEAAWIGNCGAGVVVAKHGTATVDTKELQNFYGRLQKKFGLS